MYLVIQDETIMGQFDDEAKAQDLAEDLRIDCISGVIRVFRGTWLEAPRGETTRRILRHGPYEVVDEVMTSHG